MSEREQVLQIIDQSERLLDEADEFARRNTVYYSREELSRKIKEKHNIDDSRSSISKPQDMNALEKSGL